MGYCFVVLGIFFGFNAQTVLQSYGGSFLAMFLVLHAVFVGIVLHNYLQRDVIIRSRIATIVEMLYLTTVGIFSMISLLIIQATAGYLVHFDPNFKISKIFIQVSSLPNSTLTSIQDSQIVSISNISIIIVILYFVILFSFYYVRILYQRREAHDAQR